MTERFAIRHFFSWRNIAITLIDRASCPQTRKLSRNGLSLYFSPSMIGSQATRYSMVGHYFLPSIKLLGEEPSMGLKFIALAP
jgi:hypothetical protein